jgi:hypothetical protein
MIPGARWRLRNLFILQSARYSRRWSGIQHHVEGEHSHEPHRRADDGQVLAYILVDGRICWTLAYELCHRCRGKQQDKVELSADWQLSAALLSRPVDLGNLVRLSETKPMEFAKSGVLHRVVRLLNNKNPGIANKKTKSDVLNIFSNLSQHEELREYRLRFRSNFNQCFD